MRNPERIDKILEIIGKIWKQKPDLRLCQIICNAINDGLFYIEDDIFVQKLIDDLHVMINTVEAQEQLIVLREELQNLLNKISVFEDTDYFDSL